MRLIIALIVLAAVFVLGEWWIRRREELDKWIREAERRQIRERNPWIRR